METLTAKSASARDRNETHETRKEENMRRKREREAERLAEESQLSEQKQQRSRTASPRGRDAANRPQDILLGRLVRGREISSKSLPSFGGLVLGCIEADFCE